MALPLTSLPIPRQRPRSAVSRFLGALFFLAPAFVASGCAPAPAQIIELDPAHGSVGVHADLPMTITFDQPVIPASLQGRLQITPGIPNCDMGKVFSNSSTAPCYVQWSPNNRSFTVVHTAAPYAPQVHYTYMLSAGVQSSQGVVNPLEHRWEVTSEIATTVAATNPSDGGTVAIDSPLVVSFSRDMLSETASSIKLSPAIPGTTVVQNTQDLGRFVLLAGSFFDPSTTYTLSVTAGAIDAHHQHIAAPVEVHFHAVTTSERRALLLLGPSGGPASQVVVAPLGSHTLGDPVAQFQLLPTNASGYQAAALSPNGAWLAVTGNFSSDVSSGPQGLEVVTLQTGKVVSPPGPNPKLISWSPDSNWLAYSASDGEHVFTASDNSDQLVAAGVKVGAVAAWGKDSASMLLLVTGASGVNHLEIAQVGVDIHYSVPGVVGNPSAAAYSLDGSAIAYESAGNLWYERLSNFTPSLIANSLVPLGFDRSGAVIAIAPPTQQLIHLDPATNTRTTTTLAPALAVATTVSGSSDWRQLCVLAPASSTLGATMQAFVENADGSGATQLTNASFPTTVLGAQFVG